MSAQNLAKSLESAKAFSVSMPNEEYHRRSELSNTGLNRLIDKSPAHFKYMQENPPEQTPAMRIGSVVHSAILEPDLFLETHVAMPECDRRTKVGKEFYEKFLIDNVGKTVMDNDLYQQTLGMTKSVMAHPTASALLKKNHNELSFFAEIEGVKVRCRPDIIREGKIIADLKTTDDASVKGFQRSVANFNYHRQAGFYCDIISQVTGEKYDTFTFIAVEKQPPYAVQVFVLDEESINKGREEYKLGIAKYRECLLTNSWPAYENVAVPLTLPGWKF